MKYIVLVVSLAACATAQMFPFPGPGSAPVPASAPAWAFVDGQSCAGSSTGANTTTCVLPGNVSSGHAVICTAQALSTSTTFSSGSLSGSSPTSFTQAAVSPKRGATSSAYGFYALSANPGSTRTVTVTWSNYPDAVVTCGEYSGVNSYHTGASGTGTGTVLSTGELTTTQANELLVMGGGIRTGSVTFTEAPGFIIRKQVGGSNRSALIEDKNAASPGSYSGAATASSPGEWVAVMMAFQ